MYTVLKYRNAQVTGGYNGQFKYYVILKYKYWKVHSTHGTLRVPLKNKNTHKDPVLMCP